MFSLTESSFSFGLLLGPVICGPLADNFGFYYAACALGELSGCSGLMIEALTKHFLATTALCVSITSFVFFEHKSSVREPLEEEPRAG